MFPGRSRCKGARVTVRCPTVGRGASAHRTLRSETIGYERGLKKRREADSLLGKQVGRFAPAKVLIFPLHFRCLVYSLISTLKLERTKTDSANVHGGPCLGSISGYTFLVQHQRNVLCPGTPLRHIWRPTTTAHSGRALRYIWTAGAVKFRRMPSFFRGHPYPS